MEKGTEVAEKEARVNNNACAENIPVVEDIADESNSENKNASSDAGMICI